MISTTADTTASTSSLPSSRARRKFQHPITRSLSPRENTAILTALRFFQRAHENDADPDNANSTALDTLSISDDEVDALCEYLECDTP